MGDITIADDIMDGVVDAMADVGTTRIFRIITQAALNPSDLGAAPVETVEDVSVEALLFDFDVKWMPDSSVEAGKTLALLSIGDFTTAQKSALEPGSQLIDGSIEYVIAKVRKIEVAGILTTVILQLED